MKVPAWILVMLSLLVIVYIIYTLVKLWEYQVIIRSPVAELVQ